MKTHPYDEVHTEFTRKMENRSVSVNTEIVVVACRWPGYREGLQILWVYYGLLIASRPVIVWNVVAVFINFLSIGAYRYFVRKEKSQAGG